MSVHTVFGIFASIFSLGAFAPYTIATLRGNASPNRVTWLIWTFVPGMVFASGLVVESEASNWLTGAYTAGSFTILLLSIKYGEGGFKKIDLTSFGISTLGVVGWFGFDNPLFAYFSFVTADLAGGVPTLSKSFFDPDSESITAWLLFFLGGVCSVLSIEEYATVQDWFYPWLSVVFQGLTCFFLYSRIGEDFS